MNLATAAIVIAVTIAGLLGGLWVSLHVRRWGGVLEHPAP